ARGGGGGDQRVRARGSRSPAAVRRAGALSDDVRLALRLPSLRADAGHARPDAGRGDGTSSVAPLRIHGGQLRLGAVLAGADGQQLAQPRLAGTGDPPSAVGVLPSPVRGDVRGRRTGNGDG